MATRTRNGAAPKPDAEAKNDKGDKPEEPDGLANVADDEGTEIRPGERVTGDPLRS